MLRILQTWLRLQATWTSTPTLRSERIDAPLFVVGPPRTGTTILLELLALDPSLRAPLAWEALHLLPLASDADVDREQRRRLSECEQEFWADVHPEFRTMHELASDLPCECVHFLAYDFAGPHWSMLFDTPTFTGWQLERIEPWPANHDHAVRDYLATKPKGKHGEHRLFVRRCRTRRGLGARNVCALRRPLRHHRGAVIRRIALRAGTHTARGTDTIDMTSKSS